MFLSVQERNFAIPICMNFLGVCSRDVDEDANKFGRRTVDVDAACSGGRSVALLQIERKALPSAAAEERVARRRDLREDPKSGPGDRVSDEVLS